MDDGTAPVETAGWIRSGRRLNVEVRGIPRAKIGTRGTQHGGELNSMARVLEN
jgi:hypothetical protein